MSVQTIDHDTGPLLKSKANHGPGKSRCKRQMPEVNCRQCHQPSVQTVAQVGLANDCHECHECQVNQQAGSLEAPERPFSPPVNVSRFRPSQANVYQAGPTAPMRFCELTAISSCCGVALGPIRQTSSLYVTEKDPMQGDNDKE